MIKTCLTITISLATAVDKRNACCSNGDSKTRKQNFRDIVDEIKNEISPNNDVFS